LNLIRFHPSTAVSGCVAVHVQGACVALAAFVAESDAGTMLADLLTMQAKFDFGKLTTTQLKRRFETKTHDLAELCAMLRAAWSIPNGRGDSLADDIWRRVLEVASAQGGGAPAPRRDPPPPALSASDSERLAILRSTFTAEAEILARWGVTPALPAECLAQVSDWWRAKLSGEPDLMGRSVASLERDLAQVDREVAMRTRGEAS
jgi:hypothetical protein